jgi:hypothetical protein
MQPATHPSLLQVRMAQIGCVLQQRLPFFDEVHHALLLLGPVLIFWHVQVLQCTHTIAQDGQVLAELERHARTAEGPHHYEGIQLQGMKEDMTLFDGFGPYWEVLMHTSICCCWQLQQEHAWRSAYLETVFVA